MWHFLLVFSISKNVDINFFSKQYKKTKKFHRGLEKFSRGVRILAGSYDFGVLERVGRGETGEELEKEGVKKIKRGRSSLRLFGFFSDRLIYYKESEIMLNGEVLKEGVYVHNLSRNVIDHSQKSLLFEKGDGVQGIYHVKEKSDNVYFVKVKENSCSEATLFTTDLFPTSGLPHHGPDLFGESKRSCESWSSDSYAFINHRYYLFESGFRENGNKVYEMWLGDKKETRGQVKRGAQQKYWSLFL